MWVTIDRFRVEGLVRPKPHQIASGNGLGFRPIPHQIGLRVQIQGSGLRV
jgi:hypothetical protein